MAAYKSIQTLFQGRTKEGLISLLAAAIFGGAGFGLMVAALYGSKWQKKASARKAAHPDKPWLWREDWASGRIPSSNKTSMWFAWGFAAFWNLVSGGLVIILPAEIHKGNRLALIGLIFPLIGIGLLIFAIRTTIIWKKFGQSYFKILNNPGTIGGQLNGVIETSTKIKPENGLQLRCYCVNRDSSGENTNEHLIWEEEKVIIKDSLSDPRRSAFPVFFQIPDDCSPLIIPIPTIKSSGDWKLVQKPTARITQLNSKSPFSKLSLIRQRLQSLTPHFPSNQHPNHISNPPTQKLKSRPLRPVALNSIFHPDAIPDLFHFSFSSRPFGAGSSGL